MASASSRSIRLPFPSRDDWRIRQMRRRDVWPGSNYLSRASVINYLAIVDHLFRLEFFCAEKQFEYLT